MHYPSSVLSFPRGLIPTTLISREICLTALSRLDCEVIHDLLVDLLREGTCAVTLDHLPAPCRLDCEVVHDLLVDLLREGTCGVRLGRDMFRVVLQELRDLLSVHQDGNAVQNLLLVHLRKLCEALPEELCEAANNHKL